MGQCLCKEKKKKDRHPQNQISNENQAANRDSSIDVENSGASSNSSRRHRRGREDGLSGDAFQSRVDHLVIQMLSVIRQLVTSDPSPPVAMLALHKYADRENGWLTVVRSMVKMIPIEDPLGPAVMLLLLDECPLPTKDSIADFVEEYAFSKKQSLQGRSSPRIHRNLCVILSCLAEKMAGAASVSLLGPAKIDEDGTQVIDSAERVGRLRVVHNDMLKEKGDSNDDVEDLRAPYEASTEDEASVLQYLLTNLSETVAPDVILFSLVALEKFAQTSENKRKITRALAEMNPNPLEILEVWRLNLDFVKRQVGFLAQWYLDNLFVPDGRNFTYLQVDYSFSKAVLNSKDVSEYLKISANGLEARCDAASFESVRCTHPVDDGVWYYEVEVVTAGVMQIGWATKVSKFLNHEGYGIGDDENSLAYDGCRQVVWYSAASAPHSHPHWQPGDVLGCLLSLEPGRRFAAFTLNGVSLPKNEPPSLGFLFSYLESSNASAPLPSFFAAASFMSFQQCIFNFGQTKFRFPPEIPFRSFNEAGNLSEDDARILPRHVVLESMMSNTACLGEDACTLCFDALADVTLRPCGHSGFCTACALQMETCPLCRTPISLREANEAT